MLVQFTVENYRSIKDSITFSMVSGRKNQLNVFEIRNYTLLPSAVIYGANASGKSNILKAFDFMKSMVLNRNKIMQSTDKLPHEPFRLSTETDSASSSFEAVFFFNEVKYRYGFEADSSTIYSEWLFCDEKGKEVNLFFRDSEASELKVDTERFQEGKGVKVLPNSLFIWKCDQDGGEISGHILEWFKNTNLLYGMKHSNYLGYTLKQMESADFRSEIVKLVNVADLGIRDLHIDEKEMLSSEIDKMPLPKELLAEILSGESPLTRIGIHALHNKYDEKGAIIGKEAFDLSSDDESEGTKKFFCLSAPFIDTLKNGKVLLIDELDASLHPMLTMTLVSLFNDKDINKKNAQLIFVTHDTNLLNQKIFHKSQIWFSEKDKFGATHLNSLLEFKKVRSDVDIERHYIQGKFGAIPYLGNFSFQGEQ
jgi:AAA15 family ATPase/GTPase